ncbi:MAG: putative sulfate exporter family transporter [Bdellovibrionales bacterium]|nr:putative sulfate exporter family transporter [Bdellovibrionales bacterium]
MKEQFVFGWLFLAALAYLSEILSSLIVVHGKHPVEAAVIAIIIGAALRNSLSLPQILETGVKAFEKPLVLGIVLLGAAFDYQKTMSESSALLAVILGTMLIGFLTTLFLSKFFQLPTNLGILLSLGTTICGGTAIAVCAPLMKAKEEETSYAIGVIALWGLLALLLYPTLAHYLGVSDYRFGVFAGTAIHSTPQVVGAGYMYSEEAGGVATAVKLLRNCFLAPAAFLIAVWYQKSQSASKGAYLKAVPWFLFGYFLMAWCNSQGYFTQEGSSAFQNAGKFLVLVGMVGVGLSTRISSFRALGSKPIVVGLVGAIVVALSSIALSSLLLS